MMTPILMSIKPVYTDMIISQIKTIEIRKKIGKEFHPDSWVFIYSSSPVKAIVAKFKISSIEKFNSEEITDDLLRNSCLTKSEMLKYIGCKSAYAIFIDNLTLFNPIKMQDIKLKFPKFTPPQSYFYISDELFEMIKFFD